MYTEFYKLRSEPFLLTPDPRFYFESSVHSQAMAHLTYGLSRGEGFIVITGDIGAGKTMLVQKLIAAIDSRQILAAQVVTTLLDGSDLLRMVASAFGMRDLPADKGALLLRMRHFFEEASQNNQRVLLIVDEAQNLTVAGLEELRMLSNFQIGHAAPFQSFLIGQPQFRTTLANPDLEQLRQRVIATYHLGPMSHDECGAYVSHRLSLVGWQKDPYFEPGAIEAIFEHSGGIPRRINTLCSRLMLFGLLDELHRFTADDVNKVAVDFASESGLPNTAPGVQQQVRRSTNGTNGASPSDNEVALRLSRIEQLLTHQEKFMRRAVLVLEDFLNRHSQNDS